ncbi:MAG: hypothetical protein KF774_14720 [Planctomyces sp.]|nr:hypothetical protein [Planctomyces sp.]
MRSPTLVVYDETSDTADVLSAVYAQRGIPVERRRPSLSPVADDQAEWPAIHVVDRPAPGGVERSGAGVVIGRWSESAAGTARSLHRLPAVFQYRELIAVIDRLLVERPAA